MCQFCASLARLRAKALVSYPARGLNLRHHTNQEAHDAPWFGARGSNTGPGLAIPGGAPLCHSCYGTVSTKNGHTYTALRTKLLSSCLLGQISSYLPSDFYQKARVEVCAQKGCQLVCRWSGRRQMEHQAPHFKYVFSRPSRGVHGKKPGQPMAHKESLMPTQVGSTNKAALT